MIPKSDYLSCDVDGVSYYRYVTMKLIRIYHTKDEVDRFSKWISGQTTGLIGNEPAIYVWDYERWVREGLKVYQNVDTWD